MTADDIEDLKFGCAQDIDLVAASFVRSAHHVQAIKEVLAKEGKRVAVVDREDRPGGRALSIRGDQISDMGADWYTEMLGRHYCYLAHSEPTIESIVEERLLDGYIIDLGYHGVPCGGRGYLGRLVEHLGLDFTVNPCDTGFVYDGVFYTEPRPGVTRLDDKLYKICKEKGIQYWAFNLTVLGLSEQELADLEQVSLYDYCDRLGLCADEVVWQSYRCLGTLFTTINNPHDISAGEIARYTKDIMLPLILSGEELHVGGFAVGGLGRWSEEVAAAFEEMGGELMLGEEVKRVVVEGGGVTGVELSSGRKIARGRRGSEQHPCPGDVRAGRCLGVPGRVRRPRPLALRVREPCPLLRAARAPDPGGTGEPADQDTDGGGSERRV